MGKLEKIIYSILLGKNDKNIKFEDLRHVLIHMGFKERIRGDHFIYTKPGIDEIINIQPIGSSAKPYQVRQIRNLIIKYKLGGHDDV